MANKKRRMQLDGSNYTTIRASIACHTLSVIEDASPRTAAFTYKIKDDGTANGFTTEFTEQLGGMIRLIGHGRSGILGRPPRYSGYNWISAAYEPAETAAATGDSGGGDVVLYVKAADGSSPYIIIEESVNEE